MTQPQKQFEPFLEKKTVAINMRARGIQTIYCRLGKKHFKDRGPNT